MSSSNIPNNIPPIRKPFSATTAKLLGLKDGNVVKKKLSLEIRSAVTSVTSSNLELLSETWTFESINGSSVNKTIVIRSQNFNNNKQNFVTSVSYGTASDFVKGVNVVDDNGVNQ